MTNFNDEALIFMFYSNPGGLHQVMAATELYVFNIIFYGDVLLTLIIATIAIGGITRSCSCG